MDSASAVSKHPDEEQVIVLHIEEGKYPVTISNFSLMTFSILGVGLNPGEAILIQAILSGNKLDAEPVKPGHTTTFDCNLVWETDRKSIKR